MLTELPGLLAMFAASVLLAWPLGRYIARVFAGERTWLDPIFNPLERLFFRASGIDPAREMTWQEHLFALLSINFVWFVLCFFILLNQGWLPLNPDGNPNMTPDLAFNTAISFLVNCNLQHYSGETGVSYLSQLAGLMFLQFVTAGTGMAACAMVFNAMKKQAAETGGLGNFFVYFLKSCTRVLLPVSAIAAVILVFNGTPMTFEGKAEVVTLQGDTVQVSRGPAAAMIGIKQAGTNGGGFFGVNSAHPLENPNYLTNMIENVLIVLIPIAMVFALGFYLRRRRMAWMIFGVMTFGFLLLLVPAIVQEMGGNAAITGIGQTLGSMEGKETRLGAAASAYWGITTTVTSNGSVNAMHDSFTPLTGGLAMLGMMVNALYGGVGVGFLNFYVFIILAVFISGLMVGRTPEFLGKKVEAREVKIAAIVAILHPLLILSGTALAAWFVAQNADMGWWFADAGGKGQPAGNWLNNPGFHGFSEMLYEYTSSAANNGSGFEGLADNNPFWNITTGIVLLLSRYLPIIGPLAIAGLLASKKHIPESAGTLPTDNGTFGAVIFAVMFIVAALSFFPALALGPLAEFFSL